MAKLARITAWLIVASAAGLATVCAQTVDPSDVPPRELPQLAADRWNRGPAYGNEQAGARPAEPAPPRPLPIEPSGGERLANAQTTIEPEAPRALKLAPLAPEGRPGARTGQVPSLVTGAASLGIVLGLFLLVVMVVRRGMPKGAALLPTQALEVLGHAPLIGRQQVHLVRCGNKILLLSATTAGVETLTEITDPEEVDRLSGICQQSRPQSVTASFRQVFQQFDRETPELAFPRQAADEGEFDRFENKPRRHSRSA